MVTNKQELINCYFSEGHKDPHSVYAERVGINRQDAKLEIYKYLYTQPFLKGLMNTEKEAFQAGYKAGIRRASGAREE